MTGQSSAPTSSIPGRRAGIPLDVTGVRKAYADVVACDNIDLGVELGEIVGLLGENGAGKSTLLGIIEGQVAPDAGRVVIGGIAIARRRVADSQAAGARLVRQHPELVPVFTVAEQLALARVDPRSVADFVDGLEPGRLVADLTPGERQRLEIARALGHQPRLLLLDEPTSTLGERHRDALFAAMRRVAGSGGGCLFVTHRLDEALATCDRIVVMRRGRVVSEARRDSTGWPESTRSGLLGAMFGGGQEGAPGIAGSESTPRRLGSRVVTGDQSREPLLVVASVDDRDAEARHPPRAVELVVQPGETVAIVGIEGQGQRELGLLLAGFRAATGEIRLGGQRLPAGDPVAFSDAGVAYLPGDRRGQGSVASMSVEDNLLLSRQRQPAWRRRGALDWRAAGRDARERIAAWDIRPPDPGRPAGVLSGGNLQKVLLARALAVDPRLLVADNPTHGLDVRTQELVWDSIGEVCRRGGATVVITPDLDEALDRADRVAVMRAGRLTEAVVTASASRVELSRLMVEGA